MLKVPIQSRSGNVVLAAVGALYVLAALVALASVVREALVVSALVEKALLFLLAVAAVSGVWFMLVGLMNLGVQLGSQRRRAQH